MGDSSHFVSGVLKVNGCSLLGMDDLLLYSSVTFYSNACLRSACDAASSTP